MKHDETSACLGRRRVAGICGRAAALAGLVMLAGFGLPAPAQPIQLLSADEVRRYAGDPSEPLLLPRVAGAPVIELLRPTIPGDGRLAMPVPIELAFRAGADAKVDPSSFKVLYGALKFDVTERLLKAVKVEPAGLRVEQVQIPAGSHRLLLQIADTQGRVGTRELRFTVE
jgi:hypothetical protein